MEDKVKIGVVDIGSNSIVLFVGTVYPDGRIEPANEFYTITKLGSDVKKDKMLSADAVNHTIATVKEMRKIALDEGVSDLIVTASSAVRNAENRNRFLVKCHQEFGIFPQVLSGKEEAKYTYLGAISDIETERPLITIDIGGGSTEISWGTSNLIVSGHSLDVGCVTLNDMFNLGEDYSLYKRIAATHYVRKQIAKVADELSAWLDGRRPLVIASGGTATTFAAIYHKQTVYDRERIHTTKGRRKDVALMSRTLGKMDLKSRRRLPGMEKDRAEEMPAGLLILTEVLRYFQFKRFMVSTNGLRTGILRNYAADATH